MDDYDDQDELGELPAPGSAHAGGGGSLGSGSGSGGGAGQKSFEKVIRRRSSKGTSWLSLCWLALRYPIPPSSS